MRTHKVDDWRGSVEKPDGLAVLVTEGSVLPEGAPQEFVVIADEYCRADGYDVPEDQGNVILLERDLPRLIEALRQARERLAQQKAALRGETEVTG